MNAESQTRPQLPLVWLDVLWLQVTGTLCNIACRHCFISCGPKVDLHAMMSVEQVQAAVDAAVAQGVRQIWFTGGEPMLHPQFLALLDLALAVAPVGVLTNGMLVTDALADALGERFRTSPYTLEIRVSLDGPTAALNDAVRGRGVFAQTTAGVARLAAAGLDPILAVTTLDDGGPALQSPDQDAFLALLRELGVQKPRIKWIPPFRIGREQRRARGYQPWEVLSEEDLANPEAPHRVQCGTSRTVTAEGVFPCPILINEPDFRLGARLDEALGSHPVDHPACHTCWVEGFSCST